MSSPPTSPNDPNARPVGPHRSFIQVGHSYIFEQDIRDALGAIGSSDSRDLATRLPGVNWIESVRKAMNLPVKTFNTACVYYHRFRLRHSDVEYAWQDASMAALFAACKIEDTLKKSRDILCAAHNLKAQQSKGVPGMLTPDDPSFEMPTKKILGLERLMLESAGFDFRNRHPQKLVIKLAKLLGFAHKPVPLLAYNICCDLYRTWAPLKQSTATMAIASLELAARLAETEVDKVYGEQGPTYARWGTSRAKIMETLRDLLDLYHNDARVATVVGAQHDLNTFINMRLELNKEASEHGYPRYTEDTNEENENGNGRQNMTGLDAGSTPNIISPEGDLLRTPATPASAKIQDRGREGTVRFMLDAERAAQENALVDEYYTMVEVDDND